MLVVVIDGGYITENALLFLTEPSSFAAVILTVNLPPAVGVPVMLTICCAWA